MTPSPVAFCGNDDGLPEALFRPTESVDDRKLSIRIAHEAQQRAALAHAVRLAFRLDPLLTQPFERHGEVVDRQGDVSVPGSELIRVDAEVVCQLQPVAVAGQAHEDVDRLVADRQAAALLEAERGVKGYGTIDVADAVAGVDQLGHHGIVSATSSSTSNSRPARTSRMPNASW